jgi:hypothetical protein
MTNITEHRGTDKSRHNNSGDCNTPSSTIDRTSRQKIHKDMSELNTPLTKWTSHTSIKNSIQQL